jgi:carbonic anhydrase
VLTFDADSTTQIRNTGYTFQVDGNPENNSRVSGGPAQNVHSFLQFHMHWGDCLEKGSEHLIDGKTYSAELHFVYWNQEKYPDPKMASESNHNDGLLVLGVFVKVKLKNNSYDINKTNYFFQIKMCQGRPSQS